jgi:hypothetical protein
MRMRAGAGDPMTVTEWEAHFSLWAALKSPLQLGNDIRYMDSQAGAPPPACARVDVCWPMTHSSAPHLR